MNHLNSNKKKNNSIETSATAAKAFWLATTIIFVVAIAGVTTIPPLTAQAFIDPTTGGRTEPKAPMAVSQDGNMAITCMLCGGQTGQETGK
jgi:hypothetical protein